MLERPDGTARDLGTGAGRRPLIGISCYPQQARWGMWDLPAVLVPEAYVAGVAAAGAIPVLLPPVPVIGEVAGRLDGLVLSGGGDIDPARYGAERDPQCGPSSPRRDDAELDLVAACLAAGLPLLGICRGLQVLNVALGGTLHQHLPDLVGHDGHAPVPDGYGQHEVSVTPGSRLAAILDRAGLAGHLPVLVPAHHHQAVDVLGRGLAVTARAADGTIEAAELDPGQHPFAVAVQWHPEAGEDMSLFRALAAAAARHAAGASLLA
jgi:anthranilate synthase component 2/putative glutamine amidotransferase